MSKAHPKKSRLVSAKPRLTTDAWLELGMRLLEKHGAAGITVDKLTAEAGVTRGSFYWHFKNHDEFLTELAQKWSDMYTQSVIAAAYRQPDMDPAERLKVIVIDIISIGKARMDVHFRELATTRPAVLKVVKQVDALRTEFIRTLFEELGYSGEDLNTRVHTFVVLHSLELFMHTGLGADKDLEKVAENRLKFFLS